MSQPLAPVPDSLTGLLLPLSDRTLVVPHVAMAELVPYQPTSPLAGMPAWFLGQIDWRDLRLPLLSFEAASGGECVRSDRARVAVLNALGGRSHVKFIALLIQGIPRSVRLDAQLPAADAPLAALELGAATLGDLVAKIPDLPGLEQKLADAGLV